MAVEFIQAERISQALDPDGYVVSYWLRAGEVYRLKEYEKVAFDIYGLPLGARWECSEPHYTRFKSQHRLMF